ncbi:MAG: nitrophenyl compound nitroreductase subunit ArsF family protein [Paludibacter sp.]|nr:nitrophenyl compound nitroreductase subunit ArsF family protein [Paludibacter sp.]
MKKAFSILLLSVLIISIQAATKVEVYYFHYTHRCATCKAVEAESQKIISTLYAKELKDGKIKFTAVNLDDKSSEKLADKYKVDGQSLLVIKDNKPVDLTQQGFMYARTQPEKLKAELKKVIDPLLK